MDYQLISPVEIGKVEAYELTGGNLPNKNQEHWIVNAKPQPNQVIYKENKKYYIAEVAL
jgi:hypothetical protein